MRGRRLQGFKFRRQHPIEQYVADFACISVKLIIEIDGATHSEKSELENDAARTMFVEKLGWHIIRFTNDDVFDDVDGVVEAIYKALLKCEI
ncbi:endonuclease domain-containing protein [Hellea sp.]|nr:endonuclease domain-containing protein [Hellea sp.]